MNILLSFSLDGQPPMFCFLFFLFNIAQKKKKPLGDPQHNIFYVRMLLPSFWLPYIGEKGRTLGKEYGIKWVATGNTLQEHNENLRNIMKEHDNIIEHMMGTQE